jgi:hypothetical protein
MRKNKYNYPELLRKGTVVGPVTTEMRELCKEHIRSANRIMKRPEDEDMQYWPDFLPVVRKELAKRNK